MTYVYPHLNAITSTGMDQMDLLFLRIRISIEFARSVSAPNISHLNIGRFIRNDK